MSKKVYPEPIGRSLPLIAAIAVCAAALAAAGNANADPLTMIGYDTESQMLANSNASFGTSIGVLYTNPALLVDVKNQVGVSFIFNIPDLKITTIAAPPGSEVAISIYSSTAGIVKKSQDIALPTIELPNAKGNTNVNQFSPYATVGLAYNFGVKKLQIALMAALPVSMYAARISTHYDDEREANFSNRIYFTRFGQWDKIVSFTLGAAYEPLKWFGFGLSLQLQIPTQMNLNLYIPDANVQGYSQSNTDSNIGMGVRPIVGVRFKPWDFLAIGLVWRNYSYMSIEGSGRIVLWNYHEPDPYKDIPKRPLQSFKMALNYEPMEATLGVGFQWKPFTTQVQVTWQNWEQYLDSHAAHPQSYMNPQVNPLPASTNMNAYKFHDTWNVAWSGQWQFKPWGMWAIGATYQPSPVPAQVGRTNYADNGLLGVSTGLKFDIAFKTTSLTVAWDFQLWDMFELKTYKDPTQLIDEFPDDSKVALTGADMPEAKGLQSNNPGYPGYTAGGYFFSTGASVTYNF